MVKEAVSTLYGVSIGRTVECVLFTMYKHLHDTHYDILIVLCEPDQVDDEVKHYKDTYKKLNPATKPVDINTKNAYKLFLENFGGKADWSMDGVTNVPIQYQRNSKKSQSLTVWVNPNKYRDQRAEKEDPALAKLYVYKEGVPKDKYE